MIRIAQLSCGAEYSGIQKEIERAADTVGAKIVYPEVSLDDILNVENKFGVKVASGDLNLAMARAVRIVENPDLADAVIVMTCFRCAEAAIIRSEIRKFIHEHSKIPVLELLIHRKNDSGNASYQDGSSGDDRQIPRSTGQRKAKRSHRRNRLRIDNHQIGDHERQRGHRHRLGSHKRGPEEC